jgi:hypothetical protein
VEAGRLMQGAISWLGALVGFWVLWWRGRTYWTILVMAAAPIAVAGAVSYGGEVVLRVLLFGLVPLAILAAGLLDSVRISRTAVLAFAAVWIGLLALFPLTRYGNEGFEALSPADLQSAAWVHEHIKGGATILIANRNESLYFTHPGIYKVQSLGPLLFDTESQLAKGLTSSAKHPTFIYLTNGQYQNGILYLGYPKNWLDRFVARALQTGQAQVIYHSPDAFVLHVNPRQTPHKTAKTEGVTPKAGSASSTATTPSTTTTTR